MLLLQIELEGRRLNIPGGCPISVHGTIDDRRRPMLRHFACGFHAGAGRKIVLESLIENLSHSEKTLNIIISNAASLVGRNIEKENGITPDRAVVDID